MNILAQIVETKKKEVAENKVLTPIQKLEKSIFFPTPSVSLTKYIKRPDKAGIIAEFKRKSPSKPVINLFASPKEISLGYMQAGASAISCLTDTHYFGGSNEDLVQIRKYNYCPILRKDFTIDEYQIIEAKSIGADAILLIAEILSKAEVSHLSAFAHSLGLEVILEVHSQEQIDKISPHIDIIGVNNRNLENFHTSLDFSYELLQYLPKDLCKISESGISNAKEASELKKAGYDGFLIGESFMKQPDPGAACKLFIEQLNGFTI